MFKLNYSKYSLQGMIYIFFGGGGGGLYMEGLFQFKSWFLNALGLYTVGLIMGILQYKLS